MKCKVCKIESKFKYCGRDHYHIDKYRYSGETVKEALKRRENKLAKVKPA